MVQTAGIRLPHVYEQLFTQYQRSGRVSLSSLNTILSKGKISAHQIELVSALVICLAFWIRETEQEKKLRLCKLLYQMALLM